LAHRHRTDASRNPAFRQVAVAHQPLTAILGLQVRVGGQKARYLRLNCLGKQSMRPRAQHIGQQIGKRPWLDKLQNVSVGHGVSLLRWRSGGSNTPHDTPPHPFIPSPTFAHSSFVKLPR